jgi:hypothetical protein
MNNTYKTMNEVRNALKVPGAVLVFNDRVGAQAYYVEVNGQRVRCSHVADRLTWASCKDGVRFTHRTTLERFYAPKA